MEKLEWSDKYSVGNDMIDEQHKKLFILLQNLIDGQANDQGDLLVEIALDELLKYTKYHFSEEESQMKKTSYPDADSHMAAHRAFVKKVTDFKTSFNNNEAELTDKIIDFLKDWLINHIGKTDTQLAKHINQNS